MDGAAHRRLSPAPSVQPSTAFARWRGLLLVGGDGSDMLHSVCEVVQGGAWVDHGVVYHTRHARQKQQQEQGADGGSCCGCCPSAKPSRRCYHQSMTAVVTEP